MPLQGWKFAAGSLALVLAGCSSGTSIGVNGTVVDSVGLPAAGKSVILSSGSFSKTVVTDTNGAFSVPDVPIPYAATVADTQFFTLYLGLTRNDPTLTDFAATTSTGVRTATLYGQLTGGPASGNEFDFTTVVFASPDVDAVSTGPVGSYAAQATWHGPTTTTGTLYALEVEGTYGNLAGPAGYYGYGTRSDITLADTQVLTGEDVALTPIATGTLSGTLTMPVGYSSEQWLQLLVAPGVELYLGGELSNEMFSYITPAVDGASVVLSVNAFGPSGETVSTQWTLPVSDAGVMLELPLPPTLNLPADGATDVTFTTPFTWTPLAGGVSLFQVYGNGEGFVVVTSGTSATLSQLLAGGRTLVGSSAYWSVIGYAPAASVDAAAGPRGLDQFYQGSSTIAQSVTRSFELMP